MKKQNRELVYKGDREKTESEHIAEKEALIREIKHLRRLTGDYSDYLDSGADDHLANFNSHSRCKAKNKDLEHDQQMKGARSVTPTNAKAFMTSA